MSVRGYVSNLRKALGAAGLESDSVIDFRDRGYVLQVPQQAIDLHQFDTLVDDALRTAQLGDLIAARALFTRAVDLYAGPPLGAAGDELGLVEVTAHFEERRGEAIEALTDIRLALGEHAQLPAALASEIARQPYRERLRAQLAVALYRAGRPVEALRSLHERAACCSTTSVSTPVLSCARSRPRSSPTTMPRWPGCRRRYLPPTRPHRPHVVTIVDEGEQFGRLAEEGPGSCAPRPASESGRDHGREW